MPVYLAHGFRWPRGGFTGIRVHAIVNNLEDMAVEYIQNERTISVLLQSLRDLYPSIMQHLEDPRSGRTIHFLEQYDPDDELSDNAVSQSHAFVADRVVIMADKNAAVQDDTRNISAKLDTPEGSHPHSKQRTSHSSQSSSPTPQPNPAALFLNVDEAMSTGPAVTPQAWEALAELRDKLAEGEKIGWWIVYNGDPARAYADDEDDNSSEDNYDEEIEDEGVRTPTQSDTLANSFLEQGLPTLIPAGMKDLVLEEEKKHSIGTAIPHPPPPLEKPSRAAEGQNTTRPKSSRSFVNPLSLRKKSSKANLQPRKNEEIPEPPKLKEINKKDGFRHKFFGRGSEKK